MAKKSSAKIGFEKQIWDAAVKLWGHISAAEYRKVIVGLIFLRYISSVFEKRYAELVAEGDGFEDDPDAYEAENIFFVPENARWKLIASKAHTPEIGTVIDEAMRAIEADNKTLKNVLPKNYASPDLDKRVLGEVVDLFTNMDMESAENTKDLLGRTYEYCIAQFAAYMNLAIRGIDANLGEYQADTFFNDLYANLKADFIMANPPFNKDDWGQPQLKEDARWKYGVPPAGNANYAWIQHMISHLAPNGKIGLVLANGALSTQSGGEGEIRRNIIEDDLIEGIIALPTQLFYSVTIPVTLWFITRNKQQKGKTLFIDARKMGYMIDRKHRDFTDEDIDKIADTFAAFQEGKCEDVKGFCAVASTEDIAAQDYILTPGRYVGIEEQEDDGEPFEEKMKRLTGELSELFAKSHELEEKIRKNLGAIGYEI